MCSEGVGLLAAGSTVVPACCDGATSELAGFITSTDRGLSPMVEPALSVARYAGVGTTLDGADVVEEAAPVESAAGVGGWLSGDTPLNNEADEAGRRSSINGVAVIWSPGAVGVGGSVTEVVSAGEGAGNDDGGD